MVRVFPQIPRRGDGICFEEGQELIGYFVDSAAIWMRPIIHHVPTFPGLEVRARGWSIYPMIRTPTEVGSFHSVGTGTGIVWVFKAEIRIPINLRLNRPLVSKTCLIGVGLGALGFCDREGVSPRR